MQMTIREMYEDHNFHTIMNKVRGFRRKQEFEQDMNVRISYETARFQLFHLINIQLKPEDRFKTVTDIQVFPWESEYEERKPERKEIRKISADEFHMMVKNQNQ